MEEQPKMQRNALKYLVDALLFVDLCSISVVGILLGFVIPRGRGLAADKYFLGLHRHQWGNIHLWLSMILLVLVVVHVWLNWKWVVRLSRRLFDARWKKVLLALSVSWIAVLFICWAIVRL